MNVGVIGYYGFGNLGDQLILDNLRACFADCRLIPIPVGLPGKVEDVADRLNAFDLVLLGGGQLFQDAPLRPFGNFHEWSDQLRVPIGVLGIGITRLDEKYRQALEQLIDSSLFFFVRDEESRRLLNHLKVQVAPDLSFYRKASLKKRTSPDLVCGVNLRAGRRHTSKEWVETAARLPYRKRVLPFSSHPSIGDRELLSQLDSDCPEIARVEDFSRIDFLVGTAFHSVILAIQTSTPVVAINYDPKVRRIMEAAGMKGFVLNWDEPHLLHDRVNELLDQREEVTARLQKFTAKACHELEVKLGEPVRIVRHLEKNRRGDVPIDRASRVSILISAEGRAEDLERTIESCYTQTHPGCELFLVGSKQALELAQELTERFEVAPALVSATDKDWVRSGLKQIETEMVTWIHPGDRFAPEAVAVMVTSLDQNRQAEGIQSCYWLEWNQTIEWKATLHESYTPWLARFQSPCFLIRGQYAEAFRRRKMDRVVRKSRFDTRRWIYHRNPLFFTAAEEKERLLYRGLLAFGRGDAKAGRSLIKQALTETSPVAEWRSADDLAKCLARIALTTDLRNQGEAFIKGLEKELDSPAREQLKPLLNLALGILFMTQLTTRTEREGFQRFLKGLAVLRYDTRWLQNRGFWSHCLRSLFGYKPLARGI